MMIIISKLPCRHIDPSLPVSAPSAIQWWTSRCPAQQQFKSNHFFVPMHKHAGLHVPIFFAMTLTPNVLRLIKIVHHPTTTSWSIMTKYIQFCQFRESHFNDVWHVATAIFWIIFEKSVSLDVNPISDPSRTHGYPACLSSATIWTRFFSSPLHFPLSTLHLFAEAFFFKCVEWS